MKFQASHFNAELRDKFVKKWKEYVVSWKWGFVEKGKDTISVFVIEFNNSYWKLPNDLVIELNHLTMMFGVDYMVNNNGEGITINKNARR